MELERERRSPSAPSLHPPPMEFHLHQPNNSSLSLHLPPLSEEQLPHEALLWESSSASVPPKLPPLGRILHTLLSTPYQEIDRLISRLDASVSRGPVDRALKTFLQHAEIAGRSGTTLEQIWVPLLEHVVKSRDPNNRKQVVILTQWLFQNKQIGSAIVKSFAAIVSGKHWAHRVKLGWCLTLHDLIQHRLVVHEWCQEGSMDAYFPTFLSCVPELLSTLLESSVKEEMKQRPTRLSMAASDCILLLTKVVSEAVSTSTKPRMVKTPDKELRRQSLWRGHRPSPVISVIDESRSVSQQMDTIASTSGRDSTGDVEGILWDQLDSLATLVAKLKEWNELNRPLHAAGLQQVSRKLQNLAKFRDALQSQGGGKSDLSLGASVLAACWQHFSSLMLLKNPSLLLEHRALLKQWLEGLQHSLQKEATDDKEDGALHYSNRNVQEMESFFLTCVALLLGRLEAGQLEEIFEELGSQLLNALFGLLRSKDDEIVELAVAILRVIIFQSDTTGSSTSRMEAVLPLLMELLDEQDSTARAVVVFIAHYLAVNPGSTELERLFAILDQGNSIQRRNALAVLSELFAIISSAADDVFSSLRQNVASHLLNRLGDEELTNRVEASQLFATLDATYVLPALVQRVYYRNEKVRSAASAALVSVLKGHNDQCYVLNVLLDCISNMMQKMIVPQHPGQIGVADGRKQPDVDRVMRPIQAWFSQVQNLDPLIAMILKKMFAEPSNAVMPRLLSHISEKLSQKTQILIHLVFAHMEKQSKMTEELVLRFKDGGSSPSTNSLNHVLFERLSPLLVLKVLPLRAFDDMSCRDLYGGKKNEMSCEESCITSLLIDRACGLFEFEDVRKLSAELLGRLVPSVILPLITGHLEGAVRDHDLLRAKTCLFTLCTSLWLRPKESLHHPAMLRIRKLLAQILLWPCSTIDEETAKVQHGCIDCLAMMIYAELCSNAAGSIADNTLHLSLENPGLILELDESSDHFSKIYGRPLKFEDSLISTTVSCITGQLQCTPFVPDQDRESDMAMICGAASNECEEALMLDTSFRLCMVNVLISVCQKIPNKEKQPFVSRVIPPLLKFVLENKESNMKAACIQLFFTIVYHLKEVVLPYALELFHVSVQALQSNGSTEEQIAAVKLLASLLACEDSVVTEIAPYILEAKLVLASISSIDQSSELRVLCEQLLNCLVVVESQSQ